MPAPYYILIPNGPKRGAPVKAHVTLESAKTEAARLHALYKGLLYIRILETHRDIEATHFTTADGAKPIPRIVYKCKRQLEAA